MKKYWPLIRGFLLYIVLTGMTILMCFPLFWMISSSLKTLEETNSPGIVWVSQNSTFEAYANIFQNENFLRSYFNSVFYVTLALAGTLISIAAVAYAFSRVDWPGRNVVFFLMLGTMMIPSQALIVPQYVFFNKFHWIGTFNPLIIPGFFAGGAAMIFLLRQSMAQIPKELDESAFVDGADHIQIWWSIKPWFVLDRTRPVDEATQARFWQVLMETTDDDVAADLAALLTFVADDPAARPGAMGCIGYCIGARSVLRTVTADPDRFPAGVGLHPSFCTTDDDDSPHLAVADYPGSLYIAFGTADTMQPASANTALIDATNALAKGTAEVHEGADHGFGVPGPAYHPTAADRSYDQARLVFDRQLRD